MKLSELKESIISNKLVLDKFIFLYEGSSFLVNSYIERIIKDSKLYPIRIKSLSEITSIEANVFEDSSNNLYLLDLESFDEDLTKYSTQKIIVKTQKVTDKNSEQFIIKFDKVLDWQVEEYVKVLVPGLDEAQRLWLCDIANHDINRLYLECKKINIFNVKEQKNIFDELNNDNMYEDLNSLTIFNFSNAILKKDLPKIIEILEQIQNIDIEPTGLVTILYKNFKNLLHIQMNSKATPDSLGLSPKQFAAIKRNCNVYNNESLIKIFNLLTSIDYRLKSGLLDNNKIIEYLLVNIL